jgi:mRNA interferase RelE/StbE
LERPRVAAARLRGVADCYRIKLKNAGWCVVCQVYDNRVVVLVVAVGRRENLAIYPKAGERVKE